MKKEEINNKLLSKLKNILSNQDVRRFSQKLMKQIKQNFDLRNRQTQVEYSNELNTISIQQNQLQTNQNSSGASKNNQSRPKTKNNNSKKLLRKDTQAKNNYIQTNQRQQTKQQKNKIQQLNGSNKFQRQNQQKSFIKQRAVYVNTSQIPYLHSTDLLNNLYKKSSTLASEGEFQAPLYNPPSSSINLLTKLKELNIYYCKIQSLRDMGTGWSNLIYLSIYYGQLSDLGGLNAFPSIQYLNCPYNRIYSISDVMFHPTLLSIDLQCNMIQESSQIEHLFTVDNLQYLNLLNNPVYNNKQNKRKINEKFQKIIQFQYTRLDQYIKQSQRSKWQLQNWLQVQSCNNLLKQFYSQTKQDEITVQKKHYWKNKKQNNQNFESDFQQLEANFNKFMLENKQQKGQTNNQSHQDNLRIQYIPPQVPGNQYFQDFINNIEKSQLMNENQIFCQQKIILTPLIQVIDKNTVKLGPVLQKYLTNKLYKKDLVNNPKRPINHSNLTNTNKTEKQIPENRSTSKTSKLKRISKKNLHQIGQSSTQMIGTEEENKSKQLSQFGKTTSSMSTTFSNMNSTANTFSFRRSKLLQSNSKSKQKSLNKLSLIAKISDNSVYDELKRSNIPLKTNELGTPINQSHPHPSLVKQSRLLMGRSLKNNSKQPFNNQFAKTIVTHKEGNESLQKSSFSSTLKRRPVLSGHKKQKSSILIKKQDLQ